ncbi:DUF2182 domain-containing protein [Chelativorans sp. J32]|uniref:DUF2182 domain-containing protein n=1 Tax=Chelativorans sp. J32 TaxID=935840 RepID=UPI000486139E|nr:DUF2182 domain-containing protein [Chelativorans sp. J32]
MTGTVLETVLRRDRIVVAGALAAVTALAWSYIFWLSGSMRMEGGSADADMSGMTMPDTMMGPGSVMMPEIHSWSGAEFAFVFAMWAVMMVGMMTPSAGPMILIYAGVGRQAALKGRPLAATGFFAGGYLLAWAAFSLFATMGQWGLEKALLLTPAMASASHVLSGMILVVAGLYQWTPQKDACLANCQAPLIFIQRNGGFRRDAFGSLRLGFKHGLYCIGCCWALMALLFVGGVMNILWIAAIAIFVLAEKILPSGRILTRVAGAALIAAGIWLVATPYFATN